MPTSTKKPVAKRPRGKKDPAAGEQILKQLAPPPAERNEAEVMEFLKAIDTFKRKTGKLFPSWSDILDIVKSLGYQRR
jgi:hypothetical protein